MRKELTDADRKDLKDVAIKLAAETVALILEKDHTTLREVLPQGVHLTPIVLIVALQNNPDDQGASKVFTVVCHDQAHDHKTVGVELASEALNIIHGGDQHLLMDTAMSDGKLSMSNPYRPGPKKGA